MSAAHVKIGLAGIVMALAATAAPADTLVLRGARVLTMDDEDGELTYQLGCTLKEKPQPLSVQELVRLQTYLREVLGSKTLAVRARGKLKDSAEVFVGIDLLRIE